MEAQRRLVVIPVGHGCGPLDAFASDGPAFGRFFDLERVFIHRLQDGHGFFTLDGRQLVENGHSPTQQRLQVLARGRGDGDGFHALAGQFIPHLGPALPHFGDIHLVEANHLGFVGQLGIEQLQFLVDGLKIAQRIGAEAVDQVDEHAGAFDVPQKVIPQTHARMRALDEAGDVGQHHILIIHHGHAQVGLQRGEGIVRDLGFGPGDGGQQGAFARVGHANDADVCDELQLQPQPALLARLALFGDAGGLIGGGAERVIAAAAPAAPGHQQLFARLQQLAQKFAGVRVVNLDAGRYGHFDGLAAGALLVGAAAVLAPFGLEMHLERKMVQGVVAFAGDEVDVAPAAAAAARGPATGHEFLAAKRNDAVAAIAALDIDFCLVFEHGAQ